MAACEKIKKKCMLLLKYLHKSLYSEIYENEVGETAVYEYNYNNMELL